MRRDLCKTPPRISPIGMLADTKGEPMIAVYSTVDLPKPVTEDINRLFDDLFK